MRFVNPFKSLSWNSLFQASRSRRLRRRASTSYSAAPAEVLEVRSLLSAANVAVSVQGNALTLTSDNNGDHGVLVFRVDANHVEVEANGPNTTINNGASALFNLSSVSGITVNLGKGNDSYEIFSAAGDPALNIGAGGITFQGAGGASENLKVDNESSSAMSVIGNITVQGVGPGTALAVNSSTDSSFSLITLGSNLTVGGNVSVNMSGSGSGNLSESINSLAGDLIINGSVTEQCNETGSAAQVDNAVGSAGAGNVSIGQGVTQMLNGGSNLDANIVVTGGTGNLSVGGSVSQTAVGGSGKAENIIGTTNTNVGSITINGSATQSISSSGTHVANAIATNGNSNLTIGAVFGDVNQTATATGNAAIAENDVLANSPSTGNLTLKGSITQTASSPYQEENSIIDQSSGLLTIGSQVVETGLGTTSNGTDNYVRIVGSGTCKIGLSVAQTGSSTGEVSNIVQTETNANLTIGASVNQTANGTDLANYVDNLGTGSLSVVSSVSQKATATAGDISDLVYTKGTGKLTIGVGGITINESNLAAGQIENDVDVLGAGSLSTTGTISITAANNGGTKQVTNLVESGPNSSGTLSAQGIFINASGSTGYLNSVDAAGAALNIGAGGVTVLLSGTAAHNTNLGAIADNSAITIAGSVNVTDTGSGHSDVNVIANANNSPISIGGNFVYDNHLNSTGRSQVIFWGTTAKTNAAVTLKGSLICHLAQTNGSAKDNVGFAVNTVGIGTNGGSGYGTIIGGPTTVIGGNGSDWVTVQQAQFKQQVTLNLGGSAAPAAAYFDRIEIDGSSFAGFSATTTGPFALIAINNLNGLQPTIFSGLFSANMSGSNSTILVAPSTGTGYSPVSFNGTAQLIGSAGANDQFKYRVANVTGTLTPIFFQLVTV